VLARSLLQQGKISEANASIESALKLAANSHHALVRLSLEIDRSRVLAAAGDLATAERTARQALEEARKLGLLRLQLEAGVALGEAETKGKNPEAGRARLSNLAKTASNRGFNLIAQKATAEGLATSQSIVP
jgi:uncharacterized protein HemY